MNVANHGALLNLEHYTCYLFCDLDPVKSSWSLISWKEHAADRPMHPLDPISRKTWFSAENPVIGMGSQENPVFQSIPTYFKVLVGQGIYIYMVADTQEADLCHCQQTSRLLKTLTTREVYLLITVQNAFIPQDPKSAYYCLIFYWGNCYCAGIYWATPWNLLGYTLEFIGLRPGTTYILYSPFPLTPPSIKHIPRSIGLELFFFNHIYIYIQHIYIYI